MSTNLTDAFTKNLSTPGRYTDAATPCLNLQVKSNGAKYWTFRYVVAGKRHDMSLGAYPAISLKQARARATELRSQLNQGISPKPSWRPDTKRAENPAPSKPLFRTYAAECIAAKRAEWRNEKHAAQWASTIERFANPVIGNMPIDEIDMDDVLKVLNPIWHTRTVTAERLRGRLEWIFASATTRRLRDGPNPAAWRGLLETILPRPSKIKRERHHPALDYKDTPKFIRELREMDGVTPLALEFLILNASRTGEVIGGLRSEVSDSGIWTIPGARMKAGKDHRIALGTRSMELLEVARNLDPKSAYLFSINGKALSNMAMLMLMRRMGKSVSVHGFRSCFRDWVSEETAHSPEVAEKALAHTIPNKVEAAYRRGDLMEPRRRLMADWESFCLTGTWGNVVELTKQRAA
jgi:integrase